MTKSAVNPVTKRFSATSLQIFDQANIQTFEDSSGVTPLFTEVCPGWRGRVPRQHIIIKIQSARFEHLLMRAQRRHFLLREASLFEGPSKQKISKLDVSALKWQGTTLAEDIVRAVETWDLDITYKRFPIYVMLHRILAMGNITDMWASATLDTSYTKVTPSHLGAGVRKFVKKKNSFGDSKGGVFLKVMPLLRSQHRSFSFTLLIVSIVC